MPPTDAPITAPAAPQTVDQMRRRCFAILSEAKLDQRADRCDLATFILGRKIRSWTEFDKADWRRMTDALVGWVGVREIRRQKGVEAVPKKRV
jgi:hypothetical protein